MRKVAILVGFSSLLLTACAGQPGGNFIGVNTASDVGILPPEYKRTVESALKANLKDPYSAVIHVGDGYQSTCQIGVYGTFHGWAVPVRWNAKNSFGGYTGETTSYFWFANNRLTRTSATADFCP